MDKKILQEYDNHDFGFTTEDDLEEQNNYWKDYYEPEKDDEESDHDYYFESYEDWCERRREEDIEAQRQNAIDDMYDDY